MKLYYVHDPMCSWCWAFRPIYLRLKNILPKDIELIRLLGGLAPDSDMPMPDETKQYVIDNWQRIQEELPDTQFNYDFWHTCQPRRSTYPACRAVIAARQQNINFDELMTYAIQRAYYLEARNPSDSDTLIELAKEIGCDKKQFAEDLQAKAIDDILQRELITARQLHLNSFPSFLLIQNQHYYPIDPDYHNVDQLLLNIQSAVQEN